MEPLRTQIAEGDFRNVFRLWLKRGVRQRSPVAKAGPRGSESVVPQTLNKLQESTAFTGSHDKPKASATASFVTLPMTTLAPLAIESYSRIAAL